MRRTYFGLLTREYFSYWETMFLHVHHGVLSLVTFLATVAKMTEEQGKGSGWWRCSWGGLSSVSSTHTGLQKICGHWLQPPALTTHSLLSPSHVIKNQIFFKRNEGRKDWFCLSLRAYYYYVRSARWRVTWCLRSGGQERWISVCSLVSLFIPPRTPTNGKRLLHLRQILSPQLNYLPAIFMVCLLSDFKSDPGDNDD